MMTVAPPNFRYLLLSPDIDHPPLRRLFLSVRVVKTSGPQNFLSSNTSHCLEGEVDALGFVPGDGDLLGSRAQLFMPSRDGISAGRQVAEIETAVFAGHDEEWVFEHSHITAHPGMNVALHWNRNL